MVKSEIEKTEDKSKLNGKMAFGKYAILSSVTYQLKKEPDWYWVIKPLTVDTDIRIQQLLIANQRFVTGADGDPIRVPAAELEVGVYQVAATFEETNIPDPENPEKPIIEKGASMTSAIAKLKTFPYELLMELWNAVIEANPPSDLE